MSFYRDQLEDYLSGLHVQADCVLDVGGAAKPVKDRVASWEVKQYNIADSLLEAAHESVSKGLVEKKIDSILPGIDINNPHFATDGGNETWKKWAGNPIGSGTFDLVFCLEVMEYIWNPIMAFRNLSDMVKHGGKLIISFPFVYPVHKPIEADFLRYTPQGATMLLSQAGFKSEETHLRKDRSGKLAEFYKADGMHIGGYTDVTGVIIEARKL